MALDAADVLLMDRMNKELQSNVDYAAWCRDTEGNMFGLLAQNSKKEEKTA
jgi:hypothetical protein